MIARAVSATYQKIAVVVRRIPRGRVMTYGQVAAAAGMPRAARVVGYAMRALGDQVPWQRVVGSRGAGRGGVSIKDPVGAAVQRQILEKEGVGFGRGGGIDLERFGWDGTAKKRGPKTPAGARRRPRKVTRG
jgi:methylated-DNA-protein-cysteine methyltransferase-like protein